MDQSVVFQNEDDFLEELRFDVADELILQEMVRVQIDREPVNPSVDRFFVRAAYMTNDADLKQVRIDCGVSPARAASGERDGAEAAKELEAHLKEELARLGIQVRRGAWA